MYIKKHSGNCRRYYSPPKSYRQAGCSHRPENRLQTSRLRLGIGHSLASCALVAIAQLCLSLPAGAQIGDVGGEYSGRSNQLGVREPTKDARPSLSLPDKLPAVVAFDQMVGFATDGVTPNRFALDPASIRLMDNYVLATVAVQSPSGATTTGLYGFACNHLQYRLMAYPKPNGEWQSSSSKARWRLVRDSESRNRQFRAVYGAACRIGGRSVASTEELLRHLREGRQIVSP